MRFRVAQLFQSEKGNDRIWALDFERRKCKTALHLLHEARFATLTLTTNTLWLNSVLRYAVPYPEWNAYQLFRRPFLNGHSYHEVIE